MPVVGPQKMGVALAMACKVRSKGLLTHENSKTGESVCLASKQSGDTGCFHMLYEQGKWSAEMDM